MTTLCNCRLNSGWYYFTQATPRIWTVTFQWDLELYWFCTQCHWSYCSWTSITKRTQSPPRHCKHYHQEDLNTSRPMGTVKKKIKKCDNLDIDLFSRPKMCTPLVEDHASTGVKHNNGCACPCLQRLSPVFFTQTKKRWIVYSIVFPSRHNFLLSHVSYSSSILCALLLVITCTAIFWVAHIS